MRTNGIYKDLDLSFIPNPLTGDLTPKKDIEAIKRSMQNLVLLNAFDIPFEANLKSHVKQYLFGQNNHIERANLAKDIKWVIGRLEPRVELKDVKVEGSQDQKSFIITITYAIKTLNVEQSFTIVVEKVR